MHDELNDMVAYYSEDPVARRGMENGTPLLETCNGARCAVGRRLDPKALNELLAVAPDCSVPAMAVYCKKLHIDDPFAEGARGLPPAFWHRLQMLHDSDSSWDENGLTSKGADTVERLRFLIDSGTFDEFPHLGVIPPGGDE